MRLCKTRFWKALEINPICDPKSVTLTAALHLTGEDKLKSWWQKPGFTKWFCDGDEYDTRLRAAKYTAIDTLLDLMMNPDTPASSRVAAAKQVMDHAKSHESENRVKDLEKLLEKIAGVNSPEELQRFLK